MKNGLLFFFIMSFGIGFSQNKFEQMPENTKEIHFSYQLKSKVHIDESGVYADSLFFKRNFPRLKFSQVANPEMFYLNAKILFRNLRNADKKRLMAILYLNNENYEGIYFVEQNKTIIFADRSDEEIKEIFKKYFKEDYEDYKYKVELYYGNKTKHILYPSIYYQFRFDEIEKEIEWLTETKGIYKESSNKDVFTTTVTFDKNLSKYITIGYIFKNSEFGAIKIESFESVLELTEVTYK